MVEVGGKERGRPGVEETKRARRRRGNLGVYIGRSLRFLCGILTQMISIPSLGNDGGSQLTSWVEL